MSTVLSVRPKELDFSLYSGDSFAVQFVFTDQATGAPHPLTGTWKAQVRDKGEVVTEFAVDLANIATGKISLSLTGEQTTLLAGLGAPDWDLQQDFPGGPRTWYRGTINVSSDVTHA